MSFVIPAGDEESTSCGPGVNPRDNPGNLTDSASPLKKMIWKTIYSSEQRVHTFRGVQVVGKQGWKPLLEDPCRKIRQRAIRMWHVDIEVDIMGDQFFI